MATGLVSALFFLVEFFTMVVSCHGAFRSKTAFESVKFGYSGAIGPGRWGSLSPDYSLCSKGIHQSPIDVVKKDAVYDPNLQPLKRDYKPTDATLVDNGFNIMLKYGGDGVGSVWVEGKNYTLKQMHWHSPSEHKINGKRLAAELHLVHQSDDGDLTVVAILYDLGKKDPLVSQIEEEVGILAGEVSSGGGGGAAPVPVGVVNPKPINRRTRKYFRYVGSLSTPPCSENVIWSVLGKVREISREQLEEIMSPLAEGYHRNSRPTQPLNGREVRLYREGGGEEVGGRS